MYKGLIQRIGDGGTTRIWQDRWIPDHFEGRPIVAPEIPQVQVVADLMTPSGAWNVELIKQSFAAVDAHAILSTPAKGTGPDG